MLDSFTNALVSLSSSMSVEAFTFVGSFIEEVVAPIPSPIVMTAAGALSKSAGHPFVYLFVLSAIGAAGKTLGAVLVYGVAYVAGNVFVEKFGHVFGVSQADVEKLKVKIGTGWHSAFSLTFLRALPIMSSAVVSVGCGIVRVGFLTYVVATIIGTVVRDFFYLYVGFSGVAAYHALVDGLDGIESIIQILIGALIVLALGWLYWRRHRTK